MVQATKQCILTQSVQWDFGETPIDVYLGSKYVAYKCQNAQRYAYFLNQYFPGVIHRITTPSP